MVEEEFYSEVEQEGRADGALGDAVEAPGSKEAPVEPVPDEPVYEALDEEGARAAADDVRGEEMADYLPPAFEPDVFCEDALLDDPVPEFLEPDPRFLAAPAGVDCEKSVRDYSTRELGILGEGLAVTLLENKGWTILERNWRCRYGEADIIGFSEEAPGTVALVEVKTRLDLGRRRQIMPEEAVNAAKQKRYRLIGLCYQAMHPEVENLRLDVVGVLVFDEHMASARHFEDAYHVDRA